jgi:hypothetical protein
VVAVLGLILAAAAILLFLFNLRCAGERAGRDSERVEAGERNDAIHRQMGTSKNCADRAAAIGSGGHSAAGA